MNNLLNNKHMCSGLTLIEVLLSLVILSIGISSMMFAMNQTLSIIRTARNRNTQNLIRRIDVEFPIEKVDFASVEPF